MDQLTTHMRACCAVLALAVATLGSIACPTRASATPGPAPLPAPATYAASVDATTAQALDLQAAMDEATADVTALDSRLTVLGRDLMRQTEALASVTSELQDAQQAFDDDAVALYKTGGTIDLLLESDSWNDFVSRVTLVTGILDDERQTLEEVSVVSDQWEFQSAWLQQLVAEQTTLRQLKAARQQALAAASSEEPRAVAALSPPELLSYDAVSLRRSAVHDGWRAASIPLGTVIGSEPARVSPGPPGSWTVSAFEYRSYRADGPAWQAVASWYGTEFDGLATASGELFDASDYTCAEASLPFGTRLAVARRDPLTGRDRRAIVVVNDRGPFVAGEDLELSRAAAAALGILDSGVATVTVQQVVPTGR